MTGYELIAALQKFSPKELELPVRRENDGGVSDVSWVGVEEIHNGIGGPPGKDFTAIMIY